MERGQGRYALANADDEQLPTSQGHRWAVAIGTVAPQGGEGGSADCLNVTLWGKEGRNETLQVCGHRWRARWRKGR